jgi:L-cysteate sulfo-lyase
MTVLPEGADPAIVLDRFSRVLLARSPTPLEHAGRMSAELGGPEIWLKRDDETGFGGGGNKVRKLEYLMADARQRGADVVLTAGGVQSNHVRQTAAACARLGFRCNVILERPAHWMEPEYHTSGNRLLDELFGAEIVEVEADSDLDEALAQRVSVIEGQGLKPHVVPVGGSSPLGALGYVRAALELREQIARWDRPPRAIVHATGSAGTQAGLLCGFHVAGLDVPVIGICVGRSAQEQAEMVETLAALVLDLLEHPDPLPKSAVRTDDAHIGDGYGLPTPEMLEAVSRLARAEGVLLDPVYTGKAFAGLLDLLTAETFDPDERVIFLHTGGSPALFAYPRTMGRSTSTDQPKA